MNGVCVCMCVCVCVCVCHWKCTLTSFFSEANSPDVPDNEAGADVLLRLMEAPSPESGSLSDGWV